MLELAYEGGPLDQHGNVIYDEPTTYEDHRQAAEDAGCEDEGDNYSVSLHCNIAKCSSHCRRRC